jgi:hypothetical protein
MWVLWELKTPSRVNPASSVVKTMLKKLGSSSIFEEAIDKMQFNVVDLLVLSVGYVKDDKNVILVRAAFSKL